MAKKDNEYTRRGEHAGKYEGVEKIAGMPKVEKAYKHYAKSKESAGGYPVSRREYAATYREQNPAMFKKKKKK